MAILVPHRGMLDIIDWYLLILPAPARSDADESMV